VQRVAVVGSNRGLGARIRRAEAALVIELDRYGVRLNDAGRRLLAQAGSGDIAFALTSLSSPSPPWHRLVNDDTLYALVIGKFVAVRPAVADAVTRYFDLVHDSNDSVISVYITPPPT
jgi:hypothetical protein